MGEPPGCSFAAGPNATESAGSRFEVTVEQVGASVFLTELQSDAPYRVAQLGKCLLSNDFMTKDLWPDPDFQCILLAQFWLRILLAW